MAIFNSELLVYQRVTILFWKAKHGEKDSLNPLITAQNFHENRKFHAFWLWSPPFSSFWILLVWLVYFLNFYFSNYIFSILIFSFFHFPICFWVPPVSFPSLVAHLSPRPSPLSLLQAPPAGLSRGIEAAAGAAAGGRAAYSAVPAGKAWAGDGWRYMEGSIGFQSWGIWMDMMDMRVDPNHPFYVWFSMK